MSEKKVLNLTITKKWFDMIASGEKKEEYRQDKPYWKQRFVKEGYWHSQTCKDFETIIFRNGYAKNAPTMEVECLGIKLKDLTDMKDGWFDYPVLGCRVFVISLGKILSISN
mgnify:FL=1